MQHLDKTTFMKAKKGQELKKKKAQVEEKQMANQYLPEANRPFCNNRNDLYLHCLIQ